MELTCVSPVKKKRKKIIVRPKTCIIHIVPGAKDETLSAFTEQSWKVNFIILLCYSYGRN